MFAWLVSRTEGLDVYIDLISSIASVTCSISYVNYANTTSNASKNIYANVRCSVCVRLSTAPTLSANRPASIRSRTRRDPEPIDPEPQLWLMGGSGSSFGHVTSRCGLIWSGSEGFERYITGYFHSQSFSIHVCLSKCGRSHRWRTQWAYGG